MMLPRRAYSDVARLRDGFAGPGQVYVDRVLPVGVLPVEDRFERLVPGFAKQDVEPARPRRACSAAAPEREDHVGRDALRANPFSASPFARFSHSLRGAAHLERRT